MASHASTPPEDGRTGSVVGKPCAHHSNPVGLYRLTRSRFQPWKIPVPLVTGLPHGQATDRRAAGGRDGLDELTSGHSVATRDAPSSAARSARTAVSSGPLAVGLERATSPKNSQGKSHNRAAGAEHFARGTRQCYVRPSSSRWRRPIPLTAEQSRALIEAIATASSVEVLAEFAARRKARAATRRARRIPRAGPDAPGRRAAQRPMTAPDPWNARTPVDRR
jgi:hypothetical protein